MQDKDYQKSVAKIMRKMASFKVTEEELIDFFNGVIEKSAFLKKIENKDALRFETLDKGELGVYDILKDEVKINDLHIKDILEGKSGAFFEAVDTIGHELTHKLQRQRGEKYLVQYRTEEIHDGLSFILGHEVDMEACQAIATTRYINAPEEKMARKGGAFFVDETVNSMKENRYIKKNSRTFLEKEFSSYKQQRNIEEKYNEIYYKSNEQMKEIFSKCTFEMFMMTDEEMFSKYSRGDRENFSVAFQLKLENTKPEEIAKAYVYFLGKDDYAVQKRNMVDYMNRDAFPQDIREDLKEDLTNKLMRNTDKSYFDLSMGNLLDKNQISEIYKEMLKTDMSKTRTLLFCGFVDEEGGAQILGKSILEVYKENKIKIGSSQDLIDFKKNLQMIMCNKSELSETVYKGLSHLIKNIENKEIMKENIGVQAVAIKNK